MPQRSPIGLRMAEVLSRRRGGVHRQVFDGNYSPHHSVTSTPGNGNYFPGQDENAGGGVRGLPPLGGLIFFYYAMNLA
jgi:hypothetical protein